MCKGYAKPGGVVRIISPPPNRARVNISPIVSALPDLALAPSHASLHVADHRAQIFVATPLVLGESILPIGGYR